MADIKGLIGDRIRELRTQKGLSQEKLGLKVKLHHTYIGGVERGEKNVTIESLNKIAKGLGININEIFNFLVDVEDLDKLRASMIKELNRSDPQILKIVYDLTKELNTLKANLGSRNRLKRS